MDDQTLIAEADALLSEPLGIHGLEKSARHAGRCDAVLECARMLRMRGMQEAALTLLENIEQITGERV